MRPAFEALGGSLDHAWLTFGDYDIVGIATFPNNVSAAAVSYCCGRWWVDQTKDNAVTQHERNAGSDQKSGPGHVYAPQ